MWSGLGEIGNVFAHDQSFQIVPFCKASLSKSQISFSDVRSLPDRLRAENATLPGGVRVLPDKGSMTRRYGNLAQELDGQDVTPWVLFMYCWRPLVPTLMSCESS